MNARTYIGKMVNTVTTRRDSYGDSLLRRSRKGAAGEGTHHDNERLDNERGAAMVEFAITSIILAILIFGIIEGGLGFRAKLSLSNAADSAARRGSITANDPFADFEVLNQVERFNAARGNITGVIIFKANGGLTEPPAACLLGASVTDVCNVYTTADLSRPRADFGNCIVDGGWCPTDRSTDLRDSDYIGVTVTGRFDSPSGALGSFDLSETAVLPLESKGL